MTYIVVVLMSVAMLACSVQLLNFVQLNGYIVKYSAVFKKAHLWLLGVGLCSFLCCFAMYGCYVAVGRGVFEFLAAAFMLTPMIAYAFMIWKKPAKKPIVWTSRMLRLTFLLAIVICLLNTFLQFFGALTSWRGYSLNFIYLALPVFVLPFIINACVYAISPIEKLICKKYIKNAQNFFKQRSQLIKVGVTGSYGKTGVKFILAKMLEEMYNVVATPASYNTPMGICRSIELIENDTEVFIAEMGARHCGDVKELCDLVKPSYGIITGVNNQHLETFKSIDNTCQTKFELAEALGKDGYAVFNGDNKYTMDMYQKYDRNKGIASLSEGDCWAENIVTDSNGSTFDLVIGDRRVECRCCLIGRHNVLNIAMAALMAYKLGINLNQIAHAVSQLKPVPHRLEVQKLPSGITVIDDSYNSNETGFEAALDTLSLFKGRKILVTPTVVELGQAEKECNRQLGRKAAKVADIIMLIGDRVGDFAKGLKDENFDEDRILYYPTLLQAQNSFSALFKRHDVVLLENDLPDNY